MPTASSLVDPLDGTREFINGSDEFTVNIALIDKGTPVAGAVYAPALRRLYVGGTTAHRLDIGSDELPSRLDGLRPIAVRPSPPKAGMSWSAARISIPTPSDGSSSIASPRLATPAHR